MVQWKGDISSEESGGRASRLDSIEGLQVPNFFVLTREEMEEFVETADPEEILETDFPDELASNIKEAYQDINVSSELRNASGRARDLVEGQRNGGKVTVRISGDEKGVYQHRINVGASGLVEAIKQVAASYYQVNDEGYPAIIIQRMIEPDASGAAITSYMGKYELLEAVKGLGTSLEEGSTVPELYILDDGEIAQSRVPEEQIETTINPMNGNERQKVVKRSQSMFQRSEIEKLFQELRKESLNIKFVYKRGSFYVIDAFEPSNQAYESAEVSLNAIRASPGDIEGVLGREISYTDETVPPEQYSRALVSKKGGYSSRDAQLARKEGKPALFSLNRDMEQGLEVRAEAQSTEIRKKEEEEQHQQVQDERQPGYTGEISDETGTGSSETGTEVIPLNAGNGLYLSPPFTGKYAVTEGRTKGGISPENYLSSFGDFFRFSGERAVVDVRNINDEGLEDAMEYLEAELKIVIVDRPSKDIIRKAVEQDYTVVAPEPVMQRVENRVARQEKQFILDMLREMKFEME